MFRGSELEAALTRDWSPAAARAVKVGADGLNSDLHGTAAYRAAVSGNLVAEFLEKLAVSETKP